MCHAHPSIGDYVRVQIIKHKPGQPKTVTVTAGTIIEQDERTLYSQYKLDSGFWFSAYDKILDHTPCEKKTK